VWRSWRFRVIRNGNPAGFIASATAAKPPVFIVACFGSGSINCSTEGNSCWDGGKAGMSDTLASALWCAAMMLRFAQMGWCGVNLHGGGNGFYTPIAGAPSTGFTRRPEYFGSQFGQSLAGAMFMGATLTGAGPQVTAYALEQAGRRRIAIINKGKEAASVELPGRGGGESDAIEWAVSR
jgi:hypothetical protein